MKSRFLILDFGSQFTWLIARCFRELGFYSEVYPYDLDIEEIKKIQPAGIILSGGPQSVFNKKSPKRSVKELSQIAPCLGICYGMQLICHEFGAKVIPAESKTYGADEIKWSKPFIPDLKYQKVWMSHGDVVQNTPEGFELLARSSAGHPVAFKNEENTIWTVQFHPEVHHTENGVDLFKTFALNVCKAQLGFWNPKKMLEDVRSEVKKEIPQGEKVLCALSGGVDSTVVATLLTQILGKAQVECLFIDTGLLRENEYEEVLDKYKALNLNIRGVKAEDTFLTNLKGVSDPEKKRKIIGHTFIDIFTKHKSKDIKWFAQGTLYPDIIESIPSGGPSDSIKSHHNVGGLPKELKFRLIEPLKHLFKDEVRALGSRLSIPIELLNRHPFPGPGLAIRILGDVTKENVAILKKADRIYIEELRRAFLYDKIWQAFSVLLPCRSVGVQGDFRTYEKTLVLRAVTSRDGMTADWFEFPPGFLKSVSNKITNQVPGVNRVVYDITSKPPGTIEWE